MQPPTSRLPPIKFISTHSPDSLRDALAYLRSIYNPPVRGSRLRRPTNPPSLKHATSTTDHDTADLDLDADALRTDAFERSYTIKWLTALTAQSGLSGLGEGDADLEQFEKLIEDAASLLAICAGTASAGVITRRFVFDLVDPFQSQSRFQPQSTDDVEEEKELKTVTVDLKDVPLDNHDYGSVGAQTWGGACVMAEMIAADPRAFGLCPTPTLAAAPTTTPTAASVSGPSTSISTAPVAQRLRCLELGAGTGLVSLAAGKVVQQLSSSYRDSSSSRDSSSYSYAYAGVPDPEPGRAPEPEGLERVKERMEVEVEIVATDYYPSVLQNLEENVRVNFPSGSSSTSTTASETAASASNSSAKRTSPSSRLSITTHHLDWSSFSAPSSNGGDNASPLLDNPLLDPHKFDVIYGADIIYEALHATWIKGCLRRLLRRPIPKPRPVLKDSAGDEDGHGDGVGAGEENGEDNGGVFHLIIPLRSTHAKESGTIDVVFGDNTPGSLEIMHKETIVCDADSGAGAESEEVVYAYYRIGWNDDASNAGGVS